MRRFFTIFAVLFAFVGCSQDDVVTPNAPIEKPTYYASFADAEADSRTYLDENFMLLWHNDDRISLFATTYNEEYAFADATGSNSGAFNAVDKDSYVTGNAISTTYAVYPYNAANAISNSEILTIHFPAEQSYAEDSFGRGANTMVAAAQSSSSKLLPFRNAGGYMMLKLYGENKTVKSIELKGNNEEVISGAATAEAKYGYLPLITMGAEGGKSITLTCENAVELGATEAEATTFWIVVPPITFEEGFTITVTDADGGTYTKSTSKPTTINRNEIKSMSALAPTFTGETENPETPAKPANNEIWYTATGKIDKDWTSIGSGSSYFGATVISHEWDIETGKGVITFDNDVTIIGYNAFMDCISLTSVTIPDSVTTISGYAFCNCSSLTSVTIPDSVTIIGATSFGKCSSLTSISIPDGVTTISDFAFSGCSSLTSVTIPDSVTTIGDYAFYGCSSFTSITIPDSITVINSYTFSDCSNLSNIIIPDGVTIIYESAFSGCSSLSSITIPDSVTSIGKDSFSGCSSLTSVYITDLSAWCKINFKSIGSHPLSNGSDLYLNNELVSDIIIPNDITEIKSYAFYNCHSLVSITIPDTVTTIGDYAFSGCSNLIKFKGNCASEDGRCVIIDGVLSAFASAELTEYTIPDRVTTIGDLVFYMCSSLTKVTIPDSITSIGRNAFAGCRCELIVNCDVPEKAFRGDFTKITIGDGVTTIGAEGFSGCSSLTSLTIGKGVTTIGTDAFEFCTGDLIVNCSIPSGSSPYDSAFYGSKFTSMTIGDGVTTIGDYAFYSCSSLTSVTIPDSVTTIGVDAFYNCSSLTSVDIPDSVTNIGEFAFAGCKGLTSITIPDSVTMNGRCAFLNCKSLTSVYCKPTTPPDVTLYNNKWSAFDNTAAGRTIYVPNGLVNTYKSASGWKEYADAIVGYDF